MRKREVSLDTLWIVWTLKDGASSRERFVKSSVLPSRLVRAVFEGRCDITGRRGLHLVSASAVKGRWDCARILMAGS